MPLHSSQLEGRETEDPSLQAAVAGVNAAFTSIDRGTRRMLTWLHRNATIPVDSLADPGPR